ncbi:MAG: GMC oxidoreductase [Acidipropionibacterium acidipropionici]|jgi:choline dehydrogenase-like flavoprotein|uniref:GMC family oxidoreductase N-terminal domain-containing protein n=1 Tax=Acidipropionibacterium acidipropionici TaxID=1748 RepID=UPI002F35776E
MGKHYDYVIVSGGSAGSVLANRLSADPGTSVLVLEAGRSDFRIDPFVHMPAALSFPIGSRFYDWRYETEPEPYMGGRRVYHARGKVLGGSSSINGMIFQRGNAMDYQRWAADPGMEHWDYAHCLPYFKRMEDCTAGADAWRGGSGPLRLERGPADKPIFGAFFEAAQQAGYPLTDDINGYRQEGFAPFDKNVVNGRRLSAARAYLHPVMNRHNLTVHRQDHLELYLQHEAKQPVSIGPWMKYRHYPRIGAEWLFLRRGMGATNHFEAGGFVRTNDEVDHPNLMFHFLPIAIRYDGGAPVVEEGYQVHIGPMYSDARGTLRIKSQDPLQHPAIRFNYLSTEQDRREWVEVVNTARTILAQPAFSAIDAGEISPGPAVSSDSEILDWVARDAETALHPSCTARMGTGQDAVVDPETMKVNGVEGLRAADASVMPYVTNGNIYAPVMMIAEKAADLIAGNTPLDPLTDVPYYRAGEGMPLFWPPADPRNSDQTLAAHN